VLEAITHWRQPSDGKDQKRPHFPRVALPHF
jgi:hypothetical protein